MLNLNCLSEGTCYENEKWRKEISFHITLIAHKIFNSAGRINHAEHLSVSTNSTFNEFRTLKVESEILDAVKIISAAENYFKAILLYKGFCIHKFNDSESLLKKEQKKRPINIEEIEGIERKVIAGKGVFLVGIDNITIGFSEIIKSEKHLNLLEFDKNIISFLITLNSHRNSLHYLTSSVSVLSIERNLKYLRLKEYFNQNLKDFNEKLGLEVGYSPKSFLKYDS